MKGAVFVYVENIRVKSVANPVCGPDDIIIEIHASGICGSDIGKKVSGEDSHL